MPYASNQSELLSFGVETAYKTPGTDAFKVPVINPQLGPDVSEFTSTALTGVPSPRTTVYGKVKAGGSAEIECSVDSLMAVLRLLQGDTPTSYGITGYYHHTFPFTALTESWTCEQGHTDITQFLQWEGLYCSGGTFNWSAEGLMTCTLNFVGANQLITQATIFSGTVTDYTASLPIEHMAATVKQGDTSLSTVAQSVALTVTRPTTPILAMDGTNQLVGYSIGQATMDLTLTTLFSDETLIELADAGTETSLTLFAPAPVAGQGLKVLWPTLKLKPAAPRLSGPLNQIAFTSKPYARGSGSNVPAQMYSKYIGTAGVNITNEHLLISVHGGADVDVTLPVGSPSTLATIATTIDTALDTDGTCVVENGMLCITATDAAGKTGSTSTLEITAGTGATLLGFEDSTEVTGYDAQPVIFTVHNALAS